MTILMVLILTVWFFISLSILISAVQSIVFERRRERREEAREVREAARERREIEYHRKRMARR